MKEPAHVVSEDLQKELGVDGVGMARAQPPEAHHVFNRGEDRLDGCDASVVALLDLGVAEASSGPLERSVDQELAYLALRTL